ncbi:MAG: RagB/SusD family nutrient uptake outer membrane protein [Agriterribacter sp.]
MKLRNILFLISSTAILQTACNKQLDIQPKQDVDAATAITTPENVDAAVIGMYSLLGNGALYGTNLLLLPDLQASDGYVSWRGTFQSYRQVSNKNMARDNAEALRTWQYGYAAINMANIVLEALNLVTDQDQKNQLEGEALFVRGVMHFELVRLYGLPWGAAANNTQPGIVIKTKATKDETAAFEQKARNTVAEVYAQVISDLTGAVQKLPEENGTRVNKYTAYAFLSRVYLQMHEYSNALAAADEVIESSAFELNASISAVFDNKNTKESIFEIQQNDQNNAGTANDGMATFYASLVGIGRADVRMVSAFLDTYDENDLRLSQWYYEGVGARPGNMYCSKWKSFSQNLPIVRLAEMYLTRAECNVRLGSAVGDTPENDVAKVINPLRVTLPEIADPTLDEILDVRYHELAFEGVRIHDVKRLQIATGDYDWDSDELVFPIPQREVDATNGIITQNPGY